MNKLSRVMRTILIIIIVLSVILAILVFFFVRQYIILRHEFQRHHLEQAHIQTK